MPVQECTTGLITAPVKSLGSAGVMIRADRWLFRSPSSFAEGDTEFFMYL